MVHIELALHGAPDLQEEFKEKLNYWRYEVENQRKGKIAPFVSEIKFYDIRIPDELKEQFLKDIGAKDPEKILSHFIPSNKYRHHNTSGYKKWFWKLVLFIYKRFYPFKIPKYQHKEKTHKLSKSWNNAIVLGTFDDCEKEDNLTGKKREVL